MPILGHKHAVRMAKAADAIAVETGFHCHDHAGLQRRIVPDVEKGSLVGANPDRMTGVVAP